MSSYLGLMYDTYKSYNGAFLIAGLPPMIFGILLTTTRCVRKRTMEQEEKDLNEPKLLGPVPDSDDKEGKLSNSSLTAELQPLLSNIINPNYMH